MLICYLLLKQCEIYTYKNNPDKAIQILQEVALKIHSKVKPNEEINFLYFLDMAMAIKRIR